MRTQLSRRAFVCGVMFVLPAQVMSAASPQFSGLLQTFEPGAPQIGTSALATLTPDGPVAGTVRPLGRPLSDIARDPNGSYYGDIYQRVYRIDSTTLQATLMTVAGVGITDSTWPIGVTFDTQRSRVVLATLAGTGYLFAFSPASSQWSLIRDLGNVDLQTLAYRASNDTLYGVFNNSVGQSLNELYRYGPAGESRGSLSLSYAIPAAPDSFGDCNYQLMLASDGRLALLTPPIPDPISGALGPRLYLIDPDTGAIGYDAPFPAPEPAGLAMVLLPLLIFLHGSGRGSPHPRRPWPATDYRMKSPVNCRRKT